MVLNFMYIEISEFSRCFGAILNEENHPWTLHRNQLLDLFSHILFVSDGEINAILV